MEKEKRSQKSFTIDGWFYFVLFIGSVFLANYLVNHVGVARTPGGVYLIPVWPGVMAPSGVLAIGLGFTFRDLVQRRLGWRYTIPGIVIGASLSAFLSPGLAVASGSAFLLSETFDLLVYTPLQKRNFIAAVVLSNIVGLIIDSAVFLLLAFGSLRFIEGQVIGKTWMTLAALPVVGFIRKWDKKKEQIL